MKLSWKPCPCGSPSCKRMWPLELGTFYAGTGFEPRERDLIDKAFSYLKPADIEAFLKRR